MNPVGLATMFLPRGEVCHLEEWLAYHISLGLTHFWLWDDGHEVFDDQFNPTGGTSVWGKKPWAGYSQGVSREWVDREVKAIVERARCWGATISLKKVSSIKHARNCRSVGRRQGIVLRKSVRLAKEEGLSWIGFFDVDEMILGDLGELDCWCDTKGVAYSQQFVMEDRWSQQSEPLKCADILRGYGEVRRANKCFIRTSFDAKWDCPHCPVGAKLHNEKRLAFARLGHLHFHGNLIRNKHGKISKYAAGSPKLRRMTAHCLTMQKAWKLIGCAEANSQSDCP